MTNSTNHNLKGDDMVSAALETEHIPSHQVHPLRMFTRCLQDLFKQINITISPTKIFCLCCVTLRGAGVRGSGWTASQDWPPMILTTSPHHLCFLLHIQGGVQQLPLPLPPRAHGGGHREVLWGESGAPPPHSS